VTAVNNRRPVRSFDLFDTLVARRCVDPHNVFHLVEARTGHYGYAKARIDAEARIFGGPYTLDDVYSEMSKSFGLAQDKALILKDAELAVELENIFPIREHCAEVQAGDLVISDMYLPESFLRYILTEVCRLPFTSLLHSSHGKRTGTVWKSLEQHFIIQQHLGDNYLTDFVSPQQHNVPARQTTISQRSPTEKLIADHGFGWLANLIREARLTTWDPVPERRQAQLLQIEYNFPLLFLASLSLLNSAEEKHWDVVLFSSRDCYLWSRLFNTIARALSSPIEGKYFYTSRAAKAHPSRTYVEYFNAIRSGHRSVIVDVCGTGWSSRRLIAHSNGPPTDIFLIHRVSNPSLEAKYEQIGPTSKASTVYSLPVTGDNNVLEMLNCARHPMVEDVLGQAGHFIPLFSNIAHDNRLAAFIDIYHDAFMHAASMVGRITKPDYSGMLLNLSANIVEDMYRRLSDVRSSMTEFFEHQKREEDRVWRLLRKTTEVG
jgi:hypothetical protein